MLLIFHRFTSDTIVHPFVPSGSFIGYGREPSFNSLVSPQVFVPATSFEFSDTSELSQINQIRRNLSVDRYSSGHLGFNGGMTTILSTSGIGDLLCSLLGCDTPEAASTGSGYKAYTFIPQFKYGPSLSFVVNSDITATTGLVLRRSGTVVTDMSLSAAFGSPVEVAWELQGVTTDLGDIADFSPSWQEVNSLNFSDVSVAVNDVDVPDVKKFDVSISNGLTPVNIIRSNTEPVLQIRSEFKVDMSMDISLSNADYWSHLKANDEVKFSLDITDGQDSMVIHLPRTIIRSSSIAVEPTTGDNTQSISLTALGSATARPVVIELESLYF